MTTRLEDVQSIVQQFVWQELPGVKSTTSVFPNEVVVEMEDGSQYRVAIIKTKAATQ